VYLLAESWGGSVGNAVNPFTAADTSATSMNAEYDKTDVDALIGRKI
jgi:hypothetical protein